MNQNELRRTKPEAEQSMPSAWFFSDEGKKRLIFPRGKICNILYWFENEFKKSQ